MQWVKACRASLSVGDCQGLVVDGQDIAIYRTPSGWHASSNICTHQFALLTEGYLEGELIECPLHQVRFDVRTGASEGPPDCDALRIYPVRVDGDDVWVDLE